jgi:benzoylformate decarboxylase
MVSIPMDDWDVEMDAAEAQHVIDRAVSGRTGADPAAITGLAARLKDAKNPVLVAGPDIDAAGGWDEAIALAEGQNLPVWASPATGGGRLGFPESHPHWRGVLPPGIAAVSEVLKEHDLILVVGSSVFPYYPYMPGAFLGEDSSLVQITSDPDEAARAPMGEAIISDVKLALAALNGELDGTDRPAVEPWPGPTRIEETDPLNPSTVMNTLKQVLPEDAVIVLEAPTSTMALRNQLRISKPNSYFFGAGGGLGFGLAAALGVQLAQPERQVVCVVGEGSAQYAIQAFWTASAYRVPVKFLVLRNEEYAILKWFASLESVTGAPGLDLPALDVAAVATGYGVPSRGARSRDELHVALSEALAADGPALVEARVAPGMALA